MEEIHTAKRKEEHAIRCIRRGDREYPKRLTVLEGMPETLFVKGSLPRDDMPSIAIVGARGSSPYGRLQAFSYARTLSDAGVQVISGLACGIDSEGHKGALEGNTPTFAVLGTGADVCYPSANRRLYDRILREKGGIISEYPPGTKGNRWHFPARNRIISGLSDVVLVVEARERSGSLITAGCALEQGKAVYAVPGAVTDALSRGCHRLIYDGAGIAYSPEVLLEEWGLSPEKFCSSQQKSKIVLATDLNMVYSCLDLRPKNLNDLAEKTGFAPARLGGLLMELELLGMAEECGRQYYVRKERS